MFVNVGGADGVALIRIRYGVISLSYSATRQASLCIGLVQACGHRGVAPCECCSRPL